MLTRKSLFFILIPLAQQADAQFEVTPSGYERRIKKSTHFSYLNTDLHFLRDSSLLTFHVKDTSESGKRVLLLVNTHFPPLRKNFRKKIQFVPDYFDQEYQKQRFGVHYDPLLGQFFIRSGCLIRRTEPGTHTVFYDIHAVYTDTGWRAEGTIIKFCLSTNEKKPLLQFYGRFTKEGIRGYLDPDYVREGVTPMGLIKETFYFLLFANTAECGVGLLRPGSLVKLNKQYFFNETLKGWRFWTSNGLETPL